MMAGISELISIVAMPVMGMALATRSVGCPESDTR